MNLSTFTCTDATYCLMRKIGSGHIYRIQLFSVFFFAIVYSLLSLINHYNFRTYAYDMGVQNNALYDYAHFRFNNCTLLQPELKNYLSEHFELVAILLSPFSYLFGTYTLLIFQIIAVLAGGYGVYNYIKEISSNKEIAFLAQLHFYFFYGIFSALNYDFHNNVIGAMFVPWIFYFFHKKQWKNSILVFILFIATKENMPLWAAFVYAGIAALYWKDKIQKHIALSLSVAAFGYFILVVSYIMPALANEGEAYVQIRNNYSALGSNLGEIITTLILKPVYVFKLLFVNHTGNVLGNYYKMETYIFVLLSGGVLLFFRPQFILMLLPIFAQKMFHNDFLKWGIGDHYSIEFAPLLSIGAFHVLSSIKKEKVMRYFSYSILIISLAVCIRSFDRSHTYFDRDRHRVYQSRHYKKEYNVREAHLALHLIPHEAKVSAQSPFVPHLAFRDYIYQFPVINDAEYVVISYKEAPYPLTQQSFNVQIAMLMISGKWENIYDKNEMVILKARTEN